MKQKIYPLVCLALVITVFLGLWHYFQPYQTATSYAVTENTRRKILLVPLDGRPPCRQFVIDAAKIADCQIVTPPSNLQDYYSQPGDTKAMQQWLADNIANCDAAIISIDQLLYGGLLAAREKELDTTATTELLATLQKIHADNPTIPIYAFSILPRQTPQDGIDGYQERRDLLAYSRLVGADFAGQTIDRAKLQALEAAIPPTSLSKYLAHFTQNETLNKELIDLTTTGVFKQLILGQDDGEPYSIPNIEKAHLQAYIKQQQLTSQQVFLTHGADEIALSLLAKINLQAEKLQPRVYISYADTAALERIMPYMAVDISQTISEKIALLNGTIVNSPDAADFVLLVSANNSADDTLKYRLTTLKNLQTYQQANIPVAIVDLSQHFQAQETLLPLMIEHDYPLNSLLAYAGWNTTSNAIGTTLAQSGLYFSAQHAASNLADCQRAIAFNIAFLQNRLLEDYFYLKEDIDTVNHSLQKAGYQNTADLDLEHNYRFANNMLQTSMKNHLASYKYTRAVRQPVTFATKYGDFSFTLNDLTMELSYPWPRTFEIYLHTTPYLAITN